MPLAHKVYFIWMRKKDAPQVRTESPRRWTVYVVRCSDGSLYTGITTEVVRRCAQHNTGRASRYTRSRRPVVLVYEEPAESRSLALRREAAIKAMPRRAKLALVRQEKRAS